MFDAPVTRRLQAPSSCARRTASTSRNGHDPNKSVARDPVTERSIDQPSSIAAAAGSPHGDELRAWGPWYVLPVKSNLNCLNRDRVLFDVLVKLQSVRENPRMCDNEAQLGPDDISVVVW